MGTKFSPSHLPHGGWLFICVFLGPLILTGHLGCSPPLSLFRLVGTILLLEWHSVTISSPPPMWLVYSFTKHRMCIILQHRNRCDIPWLQFNLIQKKSYDLSNYDDLLILLREFKVILLISISKYAASKTQIQAEGELRKWLECIFTLNLRWSKWGQSFTHLGEFDQGHTWDTVEDNVISTRYFIARICTE